MHVIKWIFIWVFIFLLSCAVFAYPVLQLIEWLPLCQGMHGMRGRECGYNIIWLWPLGTIVVSFIASTLLCNWLASLPKRNDKSLPPRILE